MHISSRRRLLFMAASLIGILGAIYLAWPRSASAFAGVRAPSLRETVSPLLWRTTVICSQTQVGSTAHYTTCPDGYLCPRKPGGTAYLALSCSASKWNWRSKRKGSE